MTVSARKLQRTRQDRTAQHRAITALAVTSVVMLLAIMLTPRSANAQSPHAAFCGDRTVFDFSRTSQALILGTSGDDCIIANGQDNRIFGFGGDDKIAARGGDDVVFGGPGDDELFGGRGDDQLFGFAGDDIMLGGPGDDLLVGEGGNDQAFGENSVADSKNPDDDCEAEIEFCLPTAAVSMGDSFISGEAGRWDGNSTNQTGNSNGTDRAAEEDPSGRNRPSFRYRLNQVYLENTYVNGCHRSDVAEIISADLPVDEVINLACSGAETKNVRSTDRRGEIFKREDPQGDRLRALTRTHDIEMIVLSIGGNDLGFADIVRDCANTFVASGGVCRVDVDKRVTEALPDAENAIRSTVRDIQAIMREAGDSDYRFVIQGYPSPVPRGADYRVAESRVQRFLNFCPFSDTDSTWVRDTLVKRLATSVEKIAREFDIEFLDLSDAFQGREMCSRSTSFGPGPEAEWVRFITPRYLAGEGVENESAHPNAIGQQALGQCLRLVWFSPLHGRYRCTNTPGAGPEAMVVTPF